jgi:hypothetical protein
LKDAREDAALEETLRRLEQDTRPALEAWSQAERADLAAAERAIERADRAQALRTFQRLAGVERRPFGALGVAAALLVGLTLGFLGRGLFESAPRSEGPRLLGEQALDILAPEGSVAGYDRFAWSVRGSSVQRFGLRVWNAGELDPAIAVDGLTDFEYVPTAEELERLGPRIRFEVHLQTSDRQSLAVAAGSAELR